jgi:RNA polymerase sigma-70 factor (ECF subfamily)
MQYHSMIWDKVRQGDEAAFRQLFDEQWETLFSYACKILKDQEQAQDITQSLFMHLWEKHAALPPVAAVTPYLRHALRNRLLNAIRDQHVYERHVDLFRQAALESDNSLTEGLQLKETEQQLLRSINTLPDKMKNVFYLHRIENLSVAEIAARTGSSEQTIRNQLNTALHRLRTKWNSISWFFF